LRVTACSSTLRNTCSSATDAASDSLASNGSPYKGKEKVTRDEDMDEDEEDEDDEDEDEDEDMDEEEDVRSIFNMSRVLKK
jgi:hypothetical protein